MYRVEWSGCVLEIQVGEIQIIPNRVGAVVNAANARLAGGSGVDGAIHGMAGPELMQETDNRYPQGCPTGSAVPTAGYGLNADYVFHAVGPVWNGGQDGEADLLRAAYQRCLDLAMENEVESIRFPSISTGVYAFPLDQATEIALTTVRDFMLAKSAPKLAQFILFTTSIYDVFHQTLTRLERDA